MTMNYSKHFNTTATPQTAPIPGSAQVENNAGGYVFEVSDMARLDRFLILGTEQGTYYATEQKLTIDNANFIVALIKKNGVEAVRRIKEISLSGRAPKNDPALFALSLAITFGDEATRKKAYGALSSVARIGTHLFHLAEYVNANRGWGRGMRNAFSHWYNDKSAKDLAFQLTKYANRDGWTHKDILRLAHTKPASEDHDALFKMVLDKQYTIGNADVAKYIAAVNEIKTETNVKKIVSLISDNKLPMEVIPTEARVHPEVWEALLPHMGLTGIIRNLATMTRVGIIAPMSDATQLVGTKLLNEETLQKARVHPLDLLVALMTYQSGHGFRGTNVWTPVPMVLDILEKAFYLAFKTITPTGKRFLLGLDVSGSMSGGELMGVIGLTPRVASAVMAMVTARSEEMYHMMGFSTTFMELGIKATDSLKEVIRKTDNLPFAGTDCSLPMEYALSKKIPVDTFVVYTDNETYAGRQHPVQALKQYRNKMGIDSKLVVVGMTSTNFTIADPSDMGMLDVVGFDSATPQLISQFSSKGF